MSQYKTGTVSVTNGSPTIVGSNTQWLTLSTPLYFKIDTDGAPVYEVASIDSDTQITLAANYAGATQSGLYYQLVQDFSVNYGFPLPSQGDADAADWLRRSIIEIDQAISFRGAWLDVREYGAVGDGVTDDSAAIQSAIDAAQTLRKAIYTSIGQYKIGTALEIDNPIRLFGDGGGSVFHGSGTNNIFKITSGKCAFANFAVQGVPSGGVAFLLENAHRNSFINIICYRLASKVFHLKGCIANVFYNPVLSTNAPQSPYPTGLASSIDTGFYLEDYNSISCNANTIIHPVIEGTITHGAYLGANSNNNLIAGGTIESGAIGVEINAAKHNTIQSVYLESFSAADIKIDTGSQNMLLGNECQGIVEITDSAHRNCIKGGKIATLKIASTCLYNSYEDVLIETSLQDFGIASYKKQVQYGADVNVYAPDRAIVHRSSAPTVGTWFRGDVIWQANPSAGGSPGWVCVANGTFSSATDNTGDTDGSTAVITGMTDTSDFFVGEYVTVSAGFPSSTTPYRILAKTATSVTLDTNSTSAQSDVTVATVDPVFKAMANLAS